MSDEYVFVVNQATCSRCGQPSAECDCGLSDSVENWLEEAMERRADLLLPPDEPLVPLVNVDGDGRQLAKIKRAKPIPTFANPGEPDTDVLDRNPSTVFFGDDDDEEGSDNGERAQELLLPPKLGFSAPR